MITVLVADDHALVRRGVCSFLATQHDIDVVAEAGNGTDLVALAAQHHPDVALVDLQMPGLDGVEAIRRLTRESPSTRAVVLTSYAADSDIFPALEAGALSYLLKDASPTELADAIRAAAADETVLHPRVAARVLAALRGDRSRQPSAVRDLSERELEVLRLVARGRSNADIATELVISAKTVKTHVSAILTKLGLSDRTQAAAHAWQHGVLRPPTQR